MSKDKTTQEWQPIETAPKSALFKDEIEILVFRGDFGFETQRIEIESSINWKWYKDNGFTHWMPLPKPPKTTRGIEYDNKDSNIK